MPALALWFGFAFVVATGVFYFAAELSGDGNPWAVLVCQQLPVFCGNWQTFLYAAGVLLVAHLVLDQVQR
jgi:hypothetical protein